MDDNAEEEAQKILRDNNLDYGLKPIPIVELCKKLGVSQVVSTNFTDAGISGMIINRSKSDVTIYVNRSEPPLRQRFTIAHELGHFILSGDTLTNRSIVDQAETIFEGINFRAQGITSPAEQAANHFAAAILMPRRSIRELRDVMSADFLAKIYQVSPSAMQRRLREA